MSDWDHDAASLFRDARETVEPPTDGARARVRAKLAVRIGATAAVMAGATAAKTAGAGKGAVGVGGTKLGALSLVAKLAIPALVVASGTTMAVLYERSPSPPASATNVSGPPRSIDVASTPPPPIPAESPSVSPSATIELPMEPPREAPPRKAAPLQTDTIGKSKADEAVLVARIDEALRASNPSAALDLADEHERRFPHGVLSQEREGARVIARCMSGARASAGTALFLRQHPRSPMRPRILAACGSSTSQ